MVTIRISDPVKLKPTSLSKLSAFVSFDYDSNLVSIVKELGTRVYLPDYKSWEIPDSAVPTLLNKLNDYDVTLTGVMHHEERMKINLPAGFTFTTKPYQHQLEGVMYGLENDSFLLGDDQGLGKTKQIIDLALCRKAQEGMKHCLIICGINGTKYNWANEVKIHSSEDAWVLGTRYTKRPPIKIIEGGTKEKLEDLNNIPHQFFWITNIETLRGGSYKEGKGKNAKLRFPVAERIQELIDEGIIGMVAFDEAHKAKNPDSQQGKALLSIDAPHPIPMSGTFLLNNPLDLYLPLAWATSRGGELLLNHQREDILRRVRGGDCRVDDDQTISIHRPCDVARELLLAVGILGADILEFEVYFEVVRGGVERRLIVQEDDDILALHNFSVISFSHRLYKVIRFTQF